MLPFLKKTKDAATGIIMKTREPDEMSDKSADPLETAAQDLIIAIQSGNAKAVASALQAAYEMCSSTNSYDDQNIEAAE